MLRVGAAVAMLLAMILCAPLGRCAPGEDKLEGDLAKGTRAVAFHLHKDEDLPDGAVPDVAVDIVGDFSEPIKTSVALLNVRLLAVDANKASGITPEQAVTVQLTPAQMEVLALMQKHGAKLRMRLHAKEKPKR
jgi:Flp pilus assembly protein CpaB